MRRTVLLPVRGEPTTTVAAEPARSSSNGSVRCSDGRSSRPTRLAAPRRARRRTTTGGVEHRVERLGLRQRRTTPGALRPVAGQPVDQHLQLARPVGASSRRHVLHGRGSNTRTGAAPPPPRSVRGAGRRPARRGTGRTSRCRPSGSRGRASTAAGRRPACRARAWTRRPRRCAGTAGSAGGSRGRASVPRRAAARTAAGGCRATAPRGPARRTGR